jgi:hypothetical protein
LTRAPGARRPFLRRLPGTKSFAAAWDLALHIGYDEMLSRPMERAFRGVATPRNYKGKLIGARYMFDHRLAMTALNGSPPPHLRSRNKVAK